MGRIKFNTLRTKLIAAFLTIALAPQMILASLNRRATEDALTSSANQALFAVASQTAASIDAFIYTNLSAVRVEAALPGFVDYLSLGPAQRRDSKEEEVARSTLRELSNKDTLSILSYALLDVRGKDVLDTYAPDAGLDESDRDYFKDTVSTGLPYVSNLEFSRTRPVCMLHFGSPIRSRAGEIIGVLRVSYNATAVQHHVTQRTNLAGPKSFAILFDEHGIYLAHGANPDLAFRSVTPLDPPLIEQLQAEGRLPHRPVAELSTNLPDLKESLNRGGMQSSLLRGLRDTDDELHAVAIARLQGQAWSVALAQPQDVFLAPINAQTRTAFVLAMVIGGVVILVAVFMGQLLSRPIIQLTQAVSRFAAGNLNAEITVRSKDELGLLSQSFKQMAQQLQESFATLERSNEELEARVGQRTMEVNKARIAADAANKAKSDFLARMSHELRTPLNGILGYAQILRRSKSMTGQELHDLGVIHQCGSHLLTLITDILDLSKIESQTAELQLSPLDFPQFIRKTVEVCQIRAEQKRVDLVYEPASDLPLAIHADEKRLRQVLLNLIGNAIKFTEEGRVVLRISTLAAGREQASSTGEQGGTRDDGTTARTVRFEIEDTGHGIGQDDLKQIFVPFKQTAQGKKQAEGTGLGLTISQQIVQMMGGTIQVESELNKGSVFWMDLTFAEPTHGLPPAAPKANKTIVGLEGRIRKILVVDDEAQNRTILARMLKSVGFDVAEATDGECGLELATQLKPDLIITDLMMPVLDGLEMIRRLRQLPAFSKIPIIASSASVFHADMHESAAAGADDFLPKPFEMAELLAKLGHHLELTWIYEPSDGDGATARSAASNPNDFSDRAQAIIALPSREELEELLGLTNKGRINQLLKRLDTLATENQGLSPFVARLRFLADDFRVDAMRELITKHLDGGP